MTDTVAPVRERLGTILESVEGVSAVYTRRPLNIADVDLPAFLILVDSSDYDYEEHGMTDVVGMPRIYRLMLLVKSWSQGIEFEAETECEPFFGRMIETFEARPGLDHPKGENALDNVQDARLIGDSGVINIGLAGANYVGVEWRLEVLELLPITFA